MCSSLVGVNPALLLLLRLSAAGANYGGNSMVRNTRSKRVIEDDLADLPAGTRVNAKQASK